MVEAKSPALNDRLLASTEGAGAVWQPFPDSPQKRALESEADELAYGGAAGGGKTDLLLGLAFTQHRKSIIFRREYPQFREIVERSRELAGASGKFNANEHIWRMPDGRLIEFGAVQYEESKQTYQGRPHDLKAFDELVHFTRSQYRFLCAWLRTSVPGQRCRVVSAFNPPTPGQGDWVIEEWAPWLDPHFPDPAEDGELRWFVMLPGTEDDRVTWVDGPEPFEHKGKLVTPRSRTFIRAKVEDNPVYMAQGYAAILESLPEPLRSQLRDGDFNAAAEDDPWQVIPTKWVQAAQVRWREQEKPDLPLTCLGVDVARGGKDKTVLSERYGAWFAPLEKHPGHTTPDGQSVAALAMTALGASEASVNLDCIGVGASALDFLKETKVDVRAINFANAATRTDKSGRYKLRNVRAEAYWTLREALDPEHGDDLALPDDRELLADLCAAHWKLTAAGIQVEAKEEIAARLGRSPDCADAVALAHLQVRTGSRPIFGTLTRKTTNGAG